MLRVALTAFAIELPFTIFVMVAWLLLHPVPAPEYWQVAGLLVAANGLKTALLLPLLLRRLAPIARAERDGDLDPRQLHAALRAAWSVPLRFALEWAAAWPLCYFLVAALLAWLHPATLGPAPLAVAVLFAVACFFAALPLAHTLLGWLLLDVTGRLSLAARARGITPAPSRWSLGQRLTLLSVSLALAPTCWLSAVVLAESPAPRSPSLLLLLCAFAAVPLVWAPVCAALLGSTVAAPFRGVGALIEEIVRTGDVERLARLPVHSPDEIGALASGVNSMVDRLQADAARARALLAATQQLERAKDQFVRVAAHELKTPVTILKGYSQLLLRSPERPGGRAGEMLAAIDRGVLRIQRLVDDLVATSQVAIDHVPVRHEVVDLCAVVEAVVATTQRTLRRTITLDPAEPCAVCALSVLRVRGDAARIGQVLATLLDNAALYSPDGGRIEVMVGAPPGAGEATVTVRDEGVGIPEDKQAGIFQVFHRAHTDTPHDRGGLGVGLFLAKDLVTRQGGRIWFHSEEGHGSTFGFSVPLAEGDDRDEPTGAARQDPGGRRRSGPAAADAVDPRAGRLPGGDGGQRT